MNLPLALAAARPGDTIELPPGFHGDLNLTKPVRLIGPPTAVFNSVNVGERAAGAWLQGFSVRLTPSDTTAVFSSVVRLYRTSDVTVRGLTIRSGRAPATTVAKSTTPGELTARGLTVDGCERVRVEGCDIAECVDGIVPLKGADIAIIGNSIHDTRGSPISGAGTMGLTVEANRMRDVRPVGWGDTANDGDHADMIHLWNRGLTRPMGPVRIARNVLEQGDGVGILGIFLQDNSGHGFTGVGIEGNDVILGNRQGIAVGGLSASCRIEGNRLTPTPGVIKGKEPTIILRDCDPGLTVCGNITADSRDLAPYRDNAFI